VLTPLVTDGGVADAVANARQGARRKLRWPVAEVVVETGSAATAGALRHLGEIARTRANNSITENGLTR
jgi:hypothetical protein